MSSPGFAVPPRSAMRDSGASDSLPGTMQIRLARRDDAELLLGLIAELADYERLSESVQGDTELLATSLFDRGAAEALIAEVDGEAVGYAVLFQTFSTFECRPGLWIEDLFVRPARRRCGLGRALFDHIAGLARDRGCARVEWAVLDWNEPALRFYESLDATRVDGWRTLRLEGEALERMALRRTTGGGPDGPPATAAERSDRRNATLRPGSPG